MSCLEKLELIKKEKLTAEENINRFIKKIKIEDKKINSVLELNEKAVEEARKIDERIRKGKFGKLAGLGILVKSNINVKGLHASCASLTLKDYVSGYDATVIKRIKEEGGIILGITNMDEFACGSSGETSAFGPTRNPINLELIPGGSSSGSAAAVSAEFCDIALGSDTGGSIRNPASHCGVVGVKPTYGLVSRYGLIDLSMSLDQIGPITKNVDDALLMLNVIKGKDEKDATSFNSFEINFEKLSKIKIGIPKIKADEKILEIVKKRVGEISKDKKWEIKEINLPYIDLAVQTYYPIVYVEFFSGTRKFDGRRFGKKIEDVCGKEVLRRILGGSEISKAEYYGLYYRKALRVKEIVKKEFNKAFEEVDCIILPTVPKLPHKIGEKISVEEMYNYDALTITANLAEICGISLPCGKIKGVPVGMQILCQRFQEARMFSVAKEFEKSI